MARAAAVSVSVCFAHAIATFFFFALPLLDASQKERNVTVFFLLQSTAPLHG